MKVLNLVLLTFGASFFASVTAFINSSGNDWTENIKTAEAIYFLSGNSATVPTWIRLQDKEIKSICKWGEESPASIAKEDNRLYGQNDVARFNAVQTNVDRYQKFFQFVETYSEFYYAEIKRCINRLLPKMSRGTEKTRPTPKEWQCILDVDPLYFIHKPEDFLFVYTTRLGMLLTDCRKVSENIEKPLFNALINALSMTKRYMRCYKKYRLARYELLREDYKSLLDYYIAYEFDNACYRDDKKKFFADPKVKKIEIRRDLATDQLSMCLKMLKNCTCFVNFLERSAFQNPESNMHKTEYKSSLEMAIKEAFLCMESIDTDIRAELIAFKDNIKKQMDVMKVYKPI